MSVSTEQSDELEQRRACPRRRRRARRLHHAVLSVGLRGLRSKETPCPRGTLKRLLTTGGRCRSPSRSVPLERLSVPPTGRESTGPRRRRAVVAEVFPRIDLGASGSGSVVQVRAEAPVSSEVHAARARRSPPTPWRRTAQVGLLDDVTELQITMIDDWTRRTGAVWARATAHRVPALMTSPERAHRETRVSAAPLSPRSPR